MSAISITRQEVVPKEVMMNKISMSMLMKLTPCTGSKRIRPVTVQRLAQSNSKIKTVKAKKITSSAGCPHCKPDADGNIVSLLWEDREQSWRCIICGYRGCADVIRPRPKVLPWSGTP